MKRKIISIIRSFSDIPVLENWMGKITYLIVRINPRVLSSLVGEHVFALQHQLAVTKDVSKIIDEIPSQTRPSERAFLYNFFSTIWSGQNDVYEIGPFLGGTTRAIALGMNNNPRASKASRLRTYDRFHGYQSSSELTDFLKPLLENGVLDSSDLETMGTSNNFMGLFNKIHSSHDYYQRLIVENKSIPDRKEDLSVKNDWLTVNARNATDAVLIDGCKSWFGTKYFMSEISKVSKEGTYFIFQDYGWYKCFWLPAFTQLLRSHFQLIGNVNTTYVFLLVKRMNDTVIDSNFPDSPFDLTEQIFEDIFSQLIEEAETKNDYFSAIRHTLQYAGSLAYIGNKEKAKNIILGAKKKPFSRNHIDIIKAALVSPTYTPDGKVFL